MLKTASVELAWLQRSFLPNVIFYLMLIIVHHMRIMTVICFLLWLCACPPSTPPAVTWFPYPGLRACCHGDKPGSNITKRYGDYVRTDGREGERHFLRDEQRSRQAPPTLHVIMLSITTCSHIHHVHSNRDSHHITFEYCN